MKRIINVIRQVFSKPLKFFPIVDEQGFAEKPLKFFPVTEHKYLLEQRNKGIWGNGKCSESEF